MMTEWIKTAAGNRMANTLHDVTANAMKCAFP